MKISRMPSPILLHNNCHRLTHRRLVAVAIITAIANVIGVLIPQLPAVAATSTNVHFNAINSTTKVPLSERSSPSAGTVTAPWFTSTSGGAAASSTTISFPSSAAAQQEVTVYSSTPSQATRTAKNSIWMSGSRLGGGDGGGKQHITGASSPSSSLSINTKTIDSEREQSPQDSLGGATGESSAASTSRSSLSSFASSSSSSSLSTASLTPSYKSSTSKLPMSDYGFTKNLWSNTGTPSGIRPTIPTAPAISGATSGSSSSGSSGSSSSGVRIFRNKHHHEHHWGPFFEEPLNANSSGDNLVSTAHLFTEAVLNCRVGMLKDKTVMWVRRSADKVSLLTVGNVTYSGDPRIRVKFQYPNNWRLLINPTQKEDAGVYMCQVSTHPPKVFTTNLTVLESPLRLIDEQEREVADRYYKSGSTIDLQCQISRSFLLKEHYSITKSLGISSNPEQLLALAKSFGFKDATGPAGVYGPNSNDIETGNKSRNFEKQFIKYIFWEKDDAPLPEEATIRSSTTTKWLISRLSIADAKLSDSGNYSCSIGKLFTVIVQVQVLTGELPAAVQHNGAGPTTSLLPSGCLNTIINCIAVLLLRLVGAHISPGVRIAL